MFKSIMPIVHVSKSNYTIHSKLPLPEQEVCFQHSQRKTGKFRTIIARVEFESKDIGRNN